MELARHVFRSDTIAKMHQKFELGSRLAVDLANVRITYTQVTPVPKPSMCVLLCGNECKKGEKGSIFEISQTSWNKIKGHAEKWRGLHKFTHVYDSVDWDSGPLGKCHHESCRMTLASERSLKQAINKKAKEEQHKRNEAQETSSEAEPVPDIEAEPRQTRSSIGVIHEKNKCTWCLRDDDIKNGHPLSLLSCDNGWDAFKSHTHAIENVITRK